MLLVVAVPGPTAEGGLPVEPLARAVQAANTTAKGVELLVLAISEPTAEEPLAVVPAFRAIPAACVAVEEPVVGAEASPAIDAGIQGAEDAVKCK